MCGFYQRVPWQGFSVETGNVDLRDFRLEVLRVYRKREEQNRKEECVSFHFSLVFRGYESNRFYGYDGSNGYDVPLLLF